MAFESKNLSVLAYANGFTLWHYTSTDTAALIDSEDYFADAGHMLRAGDMIMANVASGGAGIYLVSTSDGTTVDVDDLTAVGGTDTD